MLTENLPFKLASLVMALVLYLFVMQDKEGEQEYTVSVVVESEPAGSVLLTEIPDLKVVVAGRTRNLARLEQDRLEQLVLNFNSRVSHRRFTAADFNLPPGVEIRSISPDIVQLSFADKLDQDKPIRVDRRGDPAPGYRVTTRVSPETVHVEGPANEIDTLDGVFTQPIDIAGLNRESTRRVGLEQLGPRISYNRDLEVLVTFIVEVNSIPLEVTNVPVFVSGPAERFSLNRSYLNVTLTGPEAVIDAFDATSLSASVDATPFLDAPAGEYDVQPQLLNLPDEVQVESIDFETLRLTVTDPPRFECRPIPLPNVLPLRLPVFLP